MGASCKPENLYTGVSYFEFYIGRYASQSMVGLHIPVSRSPRPGHRWVLRMVSAFKTTSFSRERRCPVPIGRGLSDSALGGRLTSFLIGAEAIKNATLELFESLMRLYHARLQRRRVAIPHRCQSLEQATPVNVQGINSSLPWLSSHANRKAVWSWGFPPIQLTKC